MTCCMDLYVVSVVVAVVVRVKFEKIFQNFSTIIVVVASILLIQMTHFNLLFVVVVVL